MKLIFKGKVAVVTGGSGGIGLDVSKKLAKLKIKANKTFGAIPESLIVVADGIVKFVGGEGPFNYSIPALADFLANYKN